MRLAKIVMSAGLLTATLSLGGCYRHPGHDSDYHHHHDYHEHDGEHYGH